ncbi:MAG: glutamine--fructose-6-phosphate transaminase (isomerizing) [Acidiferrobacterales bacterium]
MCGIVGAVAERDVVPILIEGLRRLEYRGYDSAGVVVIDDAGKLQRVRAPGKVAAISDLAEGKLRGHQGLAHTRWATHGEPNEKNAHPHICQDTVSVVHNGIIENHEELRSVQKEKGYKFTSATDTEVVVHQIYDHHVEQGQNLLDAVFSTLKDIQGAYGLGVISTREPGRMIAARSGSPLVIGVGIGEHFIASDVSALLPVTQRFIFLQEGDVADITREAVNIYDASGRKVDRPVRESELRAQDAEKGEYQHYMFKEILEQPRAIADTLEGRIVDGQVPDSIFGEKAAEIFSNIRHIHIIACGTSYHAGLIGAYCLESMVGIPCKVEVASEFRYRKPVAHGDSLFVTLSQSGETADTLSALRESSAIGFEHSLAICNVAESSLVRESELSLLTRAGPEIGVASTKAFTTQLVAMILLTLVVGRHKGWSEQKQKAVIAELETLPGAIERVLGLNDEIRTLAAQFGNKNHALFLGRGPMYPVAMEGALKLKEISYIHAEAYPAGELKHGPLALVDKDMPVIAVAPNDELLEKLKSNLEEVRARGGELIVFADEHAGVKSVEGVQVYNVAPVDNLLAPIVYTIPMQMLAYHVAVLKGTDVDQPRNLAKSVTVE